jgi:hypothetical protein
MIKKLSPIHISTSLDFHNGYANIENKTDRDWSDVLVMVQDSYAQDIIIWKGEVPSNRKIEFQVSRNLTFYHLENGLRMKRIFNHRRKRAFVFYSNKAFEGITLKAIEGLRNYSELEVVYYTVGFDSSIDLPGVTCRRYEISGVGPEFSDSQFMQMIKPEIFLKALDDGIEDGLFIDSDVQVRHNVEEIFERYSSVDYSLPVLNRNFWQFLIVNGVYVPHQELKTKMGYDNPEQFQGHGITNIFLFRKEMRPLFEEWKYWCYEPEIVNDLRKSIYLHDEVIFNLLCWKNRVKQIQGNLLLNVKDLKDVKVFFHIQAEPGKSHLDLNQFNCGHFSQSFAPYDRDDIVGFHCVKDPAVAEEINTYLKGRFLGI